MTSEVSGSRLPKSARLLKHSDFSFRKFHRFKTEYFNFVYSREGLGRLGVSLSKKVLRRAVARNRVRRLLREVFRSSRSELGGLDIHIIGLAPLHHSWTGLKKRDIEDQFEKFVGSMRSIHCKLPNT